MASFQVAHIHEQGNDVIILPLGESFPMQSAEKRKEMLAGFAECVKRAGLRGTLVPVWPEGENLRFIAPKEWHPFCASMTWEWIRYNINREVSL